MADPMSDAELEEIRARLDRALEDENSLAGAELTDIIALLAEIDRLRASLELMVEAAVALGSTDEWQTCCLSHMHGLLDHEPDCFIARLRTAGEG